MPLSRSFYAINQSINLPIKEKTIFTETKSKQKPLLICQFITRNVRINYNDAHTQRVI